MTAARASELRAADLTQMLACRIDQLARELLPGGHREGHEWRAGSLAGEPGSSFGVHLTGERAGVWSDFATGEAGDALDLVAAVYGFTITDAIDWARKWLGLGASHKGANFVYQSPPRQQQDATFCCAPESDFVCVPSRVRDKTADHDRWRYPWETAKPIAGTLAETCLTNRGLRFDDPKGRILRYAARRWRKHPETDELEQHPSLLCALRDVRTGEQCGIINIYLLADGRDRIRDDKGKSNTGRASSAAVMLSPFDEPTMGLVVCEGPETGVALYQQEVRPIWCCGGAGNLAKFPVLGGIEALTIAADCGAVGERAANQLAERWRAANREVSIITPPHGDWGIVDERRPPIKRLLGPHGRGRRKADRWQA
jgi:hypothetical protein